MKAVTFGQRPPLSDAGQLQGGGFPCLEGYLELMRRCWAQDPVERPTFGEVAGVLRHLLAHCASAAGAAAAGQASGSRSR